MRSARSQGAWLVLVAFIGASLVLFWPTLVFTPFSDDHSALWNSGVRGIPWRNGFFRPLSDATFRLGDLLWGTSVAGHRAFNLVVHGVNAFLLFAWMERWAGRGTALLSSGLFLLYPFHQESIVWLVGRESALGTSSVLLGLVILTSGPWNGLRAILLATTLMVGALCYESALLLVPMALLIAWSGVVQGWPTWRQLLVPLLLPALCYLALRMNSTGSLIGGYFKDLVLGDDGPSLTTLPKVLGRLFLPPEPDHEVQLVRGAFLLVLLTITAVMLRRFGPAMTRRSVVLHGLLLLIGCSVGSIAGVSTVTSESDRFLYLPSAFLCAMVALLIAAIRMPIARWVVIGLLGLTFLWQLRANHANWVAASRITRQSVDELPAVPAQGDLWLSGLPDSYRGAYIFRNGFPEAVSLAGGPGDRIIVVPDDLRMAEVLREGLMFRGELHRPRGTDLWYHWNGVSYDAIPVP